MRVSSVRKTRNLCNSMSPAGPVLREQCGITGALIAQQQLRHKSRKESFRAVFWMTVLLNGGAFFLLTTSTGAAALQSFIGNVVK